MRRILLIFSLVFLPLLAHAEGEGANLMHANVDLSDRASLQRGARLFMNYCLSCHAARAMRYNRMGHDLGISDALVKKYLMFTTTKVGDTMQVAMRPADAKKWFGVAPPDLSVIARARGADWLYTYLQSFYIDPKRPTGVNNLVFKDVAMPDVLWNMQGWQKPVYKTVKDADGKDIKVIDHLELVQPGSESKAQFRGSVHDLVNFLVYMGEPARLIRTSMGGWVLLFIAVLTVLLYFVKKEYWKDVH